MRSRPQFGRCNGSTGMRDEVRADALLASLEQEHRGKLKVFLGRGPGVGKTYAMLQAVREQARRSRHPDRGGGDPRPPGDPGPARQARHPAAHTAPAPPAAAGGDGSGRSAGAKARHRRGGRAGPQQRPRQPPREALAGCGGVAGRRHRCLHHPQRAAPGEPQRSGVAADRGSGSRRPCRIRCCWRPTAWC